MPYRNIIGLIPTIHAAQLAGENLKVLNQKKKTSVKDMAGLGVKNIVGLSLIQLEANIIGGL